MNRIMLQSRQPSGGLIHCNDCGATAHIEVYGLGDYVLPEGWQMVRHWLRHHYFCTNCASKRIERVKRALSIH